jgi:hypothetical protein
MKSRPPMSLSARVRVTFEKYQHRSSLYESPKPHVKELRTFLLLYRSSPSSFSRSFSRPPSSTSPPPLHGPNSLQNAQRSAHVINAVTYASCCLFGPTNLLHLPLYMLPPDGPVGKTWDRLSLPFKEALQFRWALHLAIFGFSLT